MANKVMQYRYYGEGAANNQPNVDKVTWVNGSVFSNQVPIVQLGIQALPGTQLYINNSTQPVIIGATGIFELEVDTGAVITALRFSAEALDMVDDMVEYDPNATNSIGNSSAYIIVDTVYEEED